MLGICYGLHFIVHHLGGKIRPADKREYGHAEMTLVDDTPLFAGLSRTQSVWMSHGDEALELPEGFHLTAKTANAVAGIANAGKKIWAVQFHPEVHHTPARHGADPEFSSSTSAVRAPDWTPEHFIQSTVAGDSREGRERGT